MCVCVIMLRSIINLTCMIQIMMKKYTQNLIVALVYINSYLSEQRNEYNLDIKHMLLNKTLHAKALYENFVIYCKLISTSSWKARCLIICGQEIHPLMLHM